MEIWLETSSAHFLPFPQTEKKEFSIRAQKKENTDRFLVILRGGPVSGKDEAAPSVLLDAKWDLPDRHSNHWASLRKERIVERLWEREERRAQRGSETLRISLTAETLRHPTVLGREMMRASSPADRRKRIVVVDAPPSVPPRAATRRPLIVDERPLFRGKKRLLDEELAQLDRERSDHRRRDEFELEGVRRERERPLS
jgi:hypothetical protein